MSTIKILPYEYIHVLDKNSNISWVEVGPQTFVKRDHHQIITPGSEKAQMIKLSSRTFCIIKNPVQRDSQGKPIVDKHGQVQVLHMELEYRFFK